ncbi:hypothetical protein [Wolbachia endosymbiont (group B) of Hofmannophila pseudospretella]|uniref:hypothetical protein n=1 Tax=Wolbachia endosymbiont (group B) of Hofmannophila pseudospretella TaxID=3066177 RepID=UPI00333FA61D
MPFIPLYFIYFSITSFPLLSICSLYSGNWYEDLKERVLKGVDKKTMTIKKSVKYSK